MAALEWKNWLGNLRCRPARLVCPQSVQEAQAVLAHASNQDLRVRPAGTGHAWTPLVPTDDVIIKTSKLNRFLGRDGKVLHVEGGMLLRELVQHASVRGLSVPGSPIFRDISVAGIAATGSHGTGQHIGCFSDHVVGVTLLTHDGELLEIDESNPTLLNAARVNLGALGLVTALKIRCQPQMNLHSRHFHVPLQEGLDNLLSYGQEHDYVSMYWHPFTDMFWLHISDRTEQPRTFGLRKRLLHAIDDHTVHGVWAPYLMDPVLRACPRLTPTLMRGSMLLKRQYDVVWSSDHAFHYLSGIGHVWLGSTIVPVEQGAAAFIAIKENIERAAKEGHFPVNLAVHARFVGRSDAYLAMSHGRDSLCIETASLPRTAKIETYIKQFHITMAERFGGRPHWGKAHDNLDLIPSLYGDAFSQFASIRTQLDPPGRFLNPMLRRLFVRE